MKSLSSKSEFTDPSANIINLISIPITDNKMADQSCCTQWCMIYKEQKLEKKKQLNELQTNEVTWWTTQLGANTRLTLESH